MFELQSCISRRDIQLSYKVFLHLSLYEKIMIFLKYGVWRIEIILFH
jgi:hypothetical protein